MKGGTVFDATISKEIENKEGFDEGISNEIANKATIESGKDTTESVFESIHKEILDFVIEYEEEKGENSAPITFLDDTISEYQDKSYTINNFLRDNVAFYANLGELPLLNMLFEGKSSDEEKMLLYPYRTKRKRRKKYQD